LAPTDVSVQVTGETKLLSGSRQRFPARGARRRRTALGYRRDDRPTRGCAAASSPPRSPSTLL